MSTKETKLRRWKSRKRSITTSFDAIKAFVDSFVEERDQCEVPVRLEHLNNLWMQWCLLQHEYDSLDDTQEDVEANYKDRANFEKNYFHCKGMLLMYNHSDVRDTTQHTQEAPAAQNSQNQMHVKLPDVKIPVFDGDPESWLNFHDLFISLVHSASNLSNIQKFYYLRSSLSGEALKLIQTVPISSDQYAVAWKLLVDHFQQPRRLKRTYVQSLFDFPCLRRESATELHSLIERFEANVKILKQLGENTGSWDILLIHLLSSRLDPATRRDWEDYAETNASEKFQNLIDFLQRRVNVLQTVSKNVEVQQQQQQVSSKKSSNQRSGNAGSFQRNVRCCIACSGQHSLYQCAAFSKMGIDEKERLVRNNRLCRNCLRRGHIAKKCSSDSSCRECRGRHHTQLCTSQYNSSTTSSQTASQSQPKVQGQITSSENVNSKANPSSPAIHSGISSCLSQKGSRSGVLLATAIVVLVDDFGNECPVRALLDSGSECCFVTERVCQCLRSRHTKVNLPIAGIGSSSTAVRYKIRSTVKSRITDYSAVVDLYAMPRVTVDLPSVSIDASSWNVPPGIRLADPSFYESSPVDLIIGAEIFFDLFTVEGRIEMGESLPTLLNSLLGWVVCGEAPCRQQQHSSFTCNTATAADIHRYLERFWAQEEDTTPALSPQEALCEKIFVETTTRNSEGRYVVRLPLKEDVLCNLGDNRRIALRRFNLIERRLNRDPALATQYRDFMDEYVQLGHMEQVQDTNAEHKPSFFLPHHPVIRESSTTTKVRVVFDASCKSNSGVSLNDAMMVGPIVQEDLRSLIMRSRLRPVMLIADMEKMFRQIRVHPEDSCLQRIFWRPTTNEPVRTYELKTVTYGTASAPFLATRTLHKLAEDEKQKYPAAAKATLEDFYVDDFFSGADTVEEAIELRCQMDAMFASAGMQLRKWASNRPEVLQGIPEANRAVQNLVELDKAQSIKTLGLHWEPHTDQLKYVISDESFDPEMPITKRNVFSCIARLFDPLGLVGPVVLTAKIFMQTLWTLVGEDKKPYDWNRELPERLKSRWLSFYRQLKSLNYLRIARFVRVPNVTNTELHFFSDASEAAYGCCVYVRSENSQGETMVALLTSRSRVAPLKKQSLPRLELNGATLAAEMYEKITKALRFKGKAWFWVDSMTVLAWLRSSPSAWATYVANRVSKIQQSTPNCSWNHISGRENPADIISRGLMPKELLDCCLWWNCVRWLNNPRQDWPITNEELLIADAEALKEARKVSLPAAAPPEPSFVDEYVARFSSYQHLLRVTAFVRRFLRSYFCKAVAGPTSLFLTTDDLNDAETALIRLVQRQSFGNDLKALQESQPLSARSRLRWFYPFLDSKGVMRVGGRLTHAQRTFDSKHQVLLPASHPICTLLVRSQHLRQLHAAPQLLISILRLRYWIVGVRSLVKQVVHECTVCFRARPKLVEQFMAELPASRVTEARPFAITGVDYWGPIMLKPVHRRAAPQKAYVAVFVCFATKAVHLELVADLTTAKFLQALRRFVARRGLCAEMYSDNGRNFLGASNELRRLVKSKQHTKAVAQACTENGIRWRFNPPSASHFGGLWEAAIQSAQKHFVRVLGTHTLAFDDMETLLAQIECCLNSRPLVPVSDDPADLEPLTPGHFLVGSALKAVPDVDVTEIPSNRLRQWQLCQKLFQTIWKRWHLEYLSTLQPRTKWCSQPISIKEGQLVVLKRENTPPMSWPTARIVHVYPGADGVVRVVRVKTADGSFDRPVAKICVLPIHPPEPNSSPDHL